MALNPRNQVHLDTLRCLESLWGLFWIWRFCRFNLQDLRGTFKALETLGFRSNLLLKINTQ
jgi:hypothetical protein